MLQGFTKFKIQSLRDQLNLPTLKERITYFTCTRMFKILKHHSGCLQSYGKLPNRSGRRDQINLMVPARRSEIYKKSYFYRAALLWNTMPFAVKNVNSSVLNFKTSLASWIMQKRNDIYIND